jgi:tRNA threonylcarbamoyladenosine biosynthesis protein TsaE
MKIHSSSEQETIRLGEALGTILKPLDTVLMIGQLGSGKTRLAKGMISAATGVSQNDVVSPTFTLINRFEGDFPVYHADLYRIESDQFDGIGLEDALEDGGALIGEWAERRRLEADSRIHRRRRDFRNIVFNGRQRLMAERIAESEAISGEA